MSSYQNSTNKLLPWIHYWTNLKKASIKNTTTATSSSTDEMKSEFNNICQCQRLSSVLKTQLKLKSNNYSYDNMGYRSIH